MKSRGANDGCWHLTIFFKEKRLPRSSSIIFFRFIFRTKSPLQLRKRPHFFGRIRTSCWPLQTNTSTGTRSGWQSGWSPSLLQVGKSQNKFFLPSIVPKNRQKICLILPLSSMSQIKSRKAFYCIKKQLIFAITCFFENFEPF